MKIRLTQAKKLADAVTVVLAAAVPLASAAVAASNHAQSAVVTFASVQLAAVSSTAASWQIEVPPSLPPDSAVDPSKAEPRQEQPSEKLLFSPSS